MGEEEAREKVQMAGKEWQERMDGRLGYPLLTPGKATLCSHCNLGKSTLVS